MYGPAGRTKTFKTDEHVSLSLDSGPISDIPGCRRRAEGDQVRISTRFAIRALLAETTRHFFQRNLRKQTFIVTADPRVVQAATQSGVRR